MAHLLGCTSVVSVLYVVYAVAEIAFSSRPTVLHAGKQCSSHLQRISVDCIAFELLEPMLTEPVTDELCLHSCR